MKPTTETLIPNNTEQGISRKCDFCHAKEGELRPVGQFKVKLRTVDVFGTKRTACQSCARKHRQVNNVQRRQQRTFMKNKFFFYLKKIIPLVIYVFCIITIYSSVLSAQPPGMPANPDQSPIDGGLGILAALGAGYALKKLRGRDK